MKSWSAESSRTATGECVVTKTCSGSGSALRAERPQQHDDPVRFKAVLKLVDQNDRGVRCRFTLKAGNKQARRSEPQRAERDTGRIVQRNCPAAERYGRGALRISFTSGLHGDAKRFAALVTMARAAVSCALPCAPYAAGRHALPSKFL